MITCIIVDDDPISSGVLAHYCKKTPQLQLLGQYDAPQAALEYIRDNPVDLLFLDVEMPGINGFELLDSIEYAPFVVLVSSNTQYAYLAFEYRVLDFLKKPVSYERFMDSVAKVNLFEGRQQEKDEPDEIFIRSEGKLIKIPFSSIQYIQVVDDYVKIVSDAGSYLVLCTLKHIEGKLNRHFIKTHRSFVVNKNRIENLSEGKIHLGPRIIPVSKAHKPEVMRSINLL